MGASRAKTGLGTTVTVTPSGGSPVVLSGVRVVTPPKVTRGTIDVSDLATTGGMEYLAEALYDGGSLSVAFQEVAGDTQDAALFAAALAGTVCALEWTVKAASGTYDRTCSGIITEYGGDPLEINGVQMATCTFKISGDVAQAVSS